MNALSLPQVPSQIADMIVLKHGFLDSLRDYTMILAQRTANAPLTVFQFIGCVAITCDISLDAQDFRQWMREDEPVETLAPDDALWEHDPCVLLKRMAIVPKNRIAEQWSWQLQCPFHTVQISTDTSSWTIICADIHYGEYPASQVIMGPAQRYIMPEHPATAAHLICAPGEVTTTETPPLDM
ncbi:MAG TPA: hypothetical protein VKB76_18245 [Ktedonobacterales bacterium]|nr:hypothetical protein [Ktedonobacterales bacterium]